MSLILTILKLGFEFWETASVSQILESSSTKTLSSEKKLIKMVHHKVHHKTMSSELKKPKSSSKMDDVIESIKQSPWNHPIIVSSIAVLVLVLAIGGIYMIVNDGKLPWTN